MEWFLHWVEVLEPQIAVIENVPSILTRRRAGQTVQDAVQAKLEPLGYKIAAQILNAADFGTPQLRRRAFIVATAPGVQFSFPQPTHHTHVHDLFSGASTYVTVGDALSDLPAIEAGEGSDESVPYLSDPLSHYQKLAREGSSGVSNHIAMKHTDRLIQRFKVIMPGQSLKDVPLEHGQLAKLTGETVGKPFKYNNYRLDARKPSLAIPASFQSLFLHPEKNRNLTAREAARIMGFADSFVFKGKRTTMSWEKNLSQYNQIGNAVCPPVAAALGRSIERALRDAPIVGRKSISLRPSSSVRSSQKLTPLPIVSCISRMPIAEELRRIGDEFLGDHKGSFVRSGFLVTSATLPAALIFATDRLCPICSAQAAPFCRHEGEMAFLISKDDLQSLVMNGQDHGLDYHLRAAFSISHQVGHVVGEELASLGLVDLTMTVNERTGRRVRGLKVLGKWRPSLDLVVRLRGALLSKTFLQ